MFGSRSVQCAKLASARVGRMSKNRMRTCPHRRAFIPGGTWFFTVNLLQRHGNDLLVRGIGLLRNVVMRVRERHPFRIDAWVVLPEHLHCVMSLPPGDSDFIHADINLLRGSELGLGGARAPHILMCMLRALRSGRPHPESARYDFCRHV